MHGRAIQILGTGSSVGKSLITSAFCRIFWQDGFTVSPFKAQNMALNSFVTKEGGEIGRAQVVQAEASYIEPSVDMNPVLIKPTGDKTSQIIVLGKSIGNMDAMRYTRYKKKLLDTVRRSFDRLINKYEIVVIEGAGSPAEINLKRHDIVNMKMAAYARAPVILVGDIDKGGVFASLVGTLELLTRKERSFVKGIIINKFRGDKRLVKSGIDFLERRTGVKVLGVIPYFKDINIPEEDSVALETREQRTEYRVQSRKVNIAVIQLPRISNFTDFDALKTEGDVNLRYVTRIEELKVPDVIIIPGTKSTISDLMFLKDSGLADKIISIMNSHPLTHIVGICGGYQMLGRSIYDDYKVESRRTSTKALGLLDVDTHFEKKKTLSRIKARDLRTGIEITGYEIHHGLATLNEKNHFFKIIERNGQKVTSFDGVVSEDGRVMGTYIHGLFDDDSFRRGFLNRIRVKKGWQTLSQETNFNIHKELDKLANLVRKNINVAEIYKLMSLRGLRATPCKLPRL